MPSYAGRFQYQNPHGGTQQQGACRLTFEQDRLMLVPDSGDPLALDLGDIDVFAPSDYELSLTIYTGNKILLQQFGKAFQNLTHDLLEAYRARLVRCLLLEDLEELARFDGVARLETSNPDHRSFAGPAEFRLYQSNLAVLPLGATGFQWRLADIESVRLDDAGYTVNLDSQGERLIASKLAKRTREFSERLTEGLRKTTEQAASVVREVFPFLSPDQFQRVAHLMKEGRAAPLATLAAIHPQTEEALVENVLDAPLKPYFAALRELSWKGGAFAGFKLVRPDEAGKAGATAAEGETPQEGVTKEEEADSDAGSGAVEAGPEQSILHWFFFPIAGKAGSQAPANLVAWEATSATGRATYFFRLLPQDEAAHLPDASRGPVLVETAIRQLNSALVLLNFRREPIYLSDDALELRPSLHRYVIASRKIAELRRLRAHFLGRAIHNSLPAWREQVDKIIAKS